MFNEYIYRIFNTQNQKYIHANDVPDKSRWNNKTFWLMKKYPVDLIKCHKHLEVHKFKLVLEEVIT